jgi:hypothetical protein
MLRFFFCAALLCSGQALAADANSLLFDLYRKDKKVGTHSLRFTQDGDVLTVDIAINIKGKVLFIPFTYTHKNKETWRGSSLVALSSNTLTNDKQDNLRVTSSGSGYDVVHNGKASRVEGEIKTTSYWHPATPTQARLLNTQNGKVIPITFSAPKPVQLLMTNGSTFASRETAMTDKKKFNVNVAYDASGCLAGINFKPPFEGTPIIYRLVSRPSAPELLKNPLLAKCVGAK